MAKAVLKEERVFQTPFTLDDIKETWIEAKHLIIKWPNAQRRLKSDAHAKNIAARFDARKFGVIIVTEPDERGFYHVIDGFNRTQAIIMLYGPETGVPCKILAGIKTPKQAAEMFLGYNDSQHRKAVGAIDTFINGVTAQDPDKVAINAIVRSLGYRIDSNRAENTVSAVAALQKAYLSYGGDTLKSALELMQATWGLDPNAPVGAIILGYAAFLAQFRNKVNWGRLKDAVSKKFTPGSFLGAARTLREAERGSLNDAVVRLLISCYNRGLKTGQLKS